MITCSAKMHPPVEFVLSSKLDAPALRFSSYGLSARFWDSHTRSPNDYLFYVDLLRQDS